MNAMSQKIRKSREYWETHLATWREGGGAMSVYCRENGIPYASFANWKRRLLEEQEDSHGSPFVEIISKEQTENRNYHTFELAFGDMRLTLREDVRQERLWSIIAVLRRARQC